MTFEVILAYAFVAALSIISPGPGVVLALRNGVAFGVGSVVWSSLGNITGLFILSAAATLGLGALLMSSAMLFTIVKILGAIYLFYIGAKHLFGKTSIISAQALASGQTSCPSRIQLYREALFIAATNPKPILFFTALFPQFINTQNPLLPQFFVLTGIFMALSFCSLMCYAVVSSRASRLLAKPKFLKWINRVIGSIFVGFGAALLTLRRPVV